MNANQLSDKQAVQKWRSYYENFLADVESVHGESEHDKRKRRTRLEADFEEWKKYYFPKYCYAPAAPFHVRGSRRVLDNPEWYETRAWARELAKDVVCMMETLYQTLTGVKKNVLFISNSWDKASELLEPYRINLEKNERIINDYGVQKMPGSWAYGDFVTSQGVSFLGVGALQSPRGSRNEEVRPDKIIVSDIDTDEDVRNTDTIDKKWDWFEKAVYPTRSVSKPFQVMFLGNVIAKDCCVVRAGLMSDYLDTIGLEDKNGNSTWPAKNTPEHIDRIKSKISTKAYQGEYMNNPLTEGTTFKEITWGKAPSLNQLPFVVVYADPSTSNKENKGKKKNAGSFKSIFLVGKKDGRYYIYTGFLEQTSNAKFVDWFYALRDYVGNKAQVYNYIENNTLQDPFYEQVFKPLFFETGREKGILSISPDTRRKPEKFTRIEGNLEPINRNGQLIFNEAEKGNPHMQRLEEQFKLIAPNLPAPADGPDCIEGAKWILDTKQAQQDVGSIYIHRRPHNSRRV